MTSLGLYGSGSVSIPIIPWDPTSVGEGNETFFIRLWKLLPNRCVLKTLRESLKGKVQREQYLLAVDFGLLQMVSEPDSGRGASEETEPQRGGHEAVCQQGRWVPKRGGLGIPHRLEKKWVSARTLGLEGVDCEIPHQLERRTKHSL